MSLENLPKEVLIGLAGITLVGVGVFVYQSRQQVVVSPVQILSSSTESGRIISDNIYVDINGAVVHPGVYQMGSKSRVDDVLNAAGGLADNADTKWFEVNINRAAEIKDGMKIYIPRKNETNVQGSIINNQFKNNKINLNTATQAELESLPDIGAVYAVKIMTNRPYSRVEDLVTKKILGDKLFSRIKDLITVW